MSGSNASAISPLAVGTSDAGDFSSWLGRPVTIDSETYVVCTAAAAIASGSNGAQLVTAISGGVGNFNVSLATGAAGTAQLYNCGVIPWSHTGPIAAGAAFLALRDSPGAVMLIIAAVTGGDGAISGGVLLMAAGTGSTLAPVITGAAGTTGTTTQIDNMGKSAGIALTATTAVVAVSGSVAYHAPFRAAQ